MLDYVNAALEGFFLGASLIIAIGAQNAFVLRQGLVARHVGPVVAICALSDALLISLGAAGMGSLVNASAGLFVGLAFAGAAAAQLRLGGTPLPGSAPGPGRGGDRVRGAAACVPLDRARRRRPLTTARRPA